MSPYNHIISNRTLIEVTRLAPLIELYIQAYPTAAKQTLKQSSSLKSYYLISVPTDTNLPKIATDDTIKKVAPKIFIQEIIGLVIPKNMWPDVHDDEVFKKYLLAVDKGNVTDFGEGEIVNFEFQGDFYT